MIAIQEHYYPVKIIDTSCIKTRQYSRTEDAPEGMIAFRVADPVYTYLRDEKVYLVSPINDTIFSFDKN